MKKLAVCVLVALMTLGSAFAAPIKGLVDIATGKEIPDADLRYLKVGTTVTNTVGVFSNLTVTAMLNLFGNAITNVDNSVLLYADGTQPLMAPWNVGGFGMTNLGTLLPSGSNTIDIGSAALPWRHGYFGDSSLFLGDYAVTKAKAQAWDLSSSATLDTVAQSGSNTTANVYLNGGWTTIGTVDGTQTYSGSDPGRLNIGFVYSTGTRTNSAGGTLNAGYVYRFASQNAAARGAENHGFLDLGFQDATGQASENHGWLKGSSRQVASGAGSFNWGYLDIGSTQLVSGAGSFNAGFMDNSGLQENTGNGSFIFGGPGTNTHNYSMVVGAGLSSVDTNSLLVRMLYATQGIMPTSSNTTDIGSQTMPFRTVNASNFNVVGSSISFNGEVAMTKSGSSVVVHGGLQDTNGTPYASQGSNTYSGVQYMPQGIMLNSNVFFNFGYYNGLTAGVYFVEGGTTTNWLLFR